MKTCLLLLLSARASERCAAEFTERSLQERLDGPLTLLDFGAKGLELPRRVLKRADAVLQGSRT